MVAGPDDEQDFPDQPADKTQFLDGSRGAKLIMGNDGSAQAFHGRSIGCLGSDDGAGPRRASFARVEVMEKAEDVTEEK